MMRRVLFDERGVAVAAFDTDEEALNELAHARAAHGESCTCLVEDVYDNESAFEKEGA